MVPGAIYPLSPDDWSHNTIRSEFLKHLRTVYQNRKGYYMEPPDLREFEEQLPIGGRYFCWQYQGFSSTADWVVVVFASTATNSEYEARVVARGVFRLGDY